MTITVRGPNGIVINFPDGTDQATIDRAMQESAGQASGTPLRSNSPAPPQPSTAAPPGLTPFPQQSGYDAMRSHQPGTEGNPPVAPPQPFSQTMSDFGNGLGDLGHSMVDGLTFGNSDTIGGVLGGIRSVMQPGGTWDEGYQPNVQGERERLTLAQERNPVLSTIGNVAGSLPAFAIPGANVARWVTQGAGMPAKIGRSALVGAGAGAASGAGHADGGSFLDRLAGAGSGMAWGAALGGVMPPLAAGLGWGANRAIAAARGLNPTANAGARVTSALREAGETPQSVGAQMAQNPAFNAANVSPTLQGMLQGVAVNPGKAKNITAAALGAQRAGAPLRTEQAFDTALGTQTPDVLAYLNQLKATTQANASVGFGNALNGAKPVDLTAAIDAIEDMVSPGVRALPGMATRPPTPLENELLRIMDQLTNGGQGMLTDPQRLHAIQSAIRRQAETLAGSANAADHLVANSLRDVRQELITAIDDAAGGAYRPALRQYADDMAIQDAFNLGTTVFQNPTGPAGITQRPEYWRDAVLNMTPAERDALRTGIRVAGDTVMGSVRNPALAGQTIAAIDFNVERLAAAVGQRNADRIVKTMQQEGAIARDASRVMDNSQTAQRQAAAAMVPIRSQKTISPTDVAGSSLLGPYAAFSAVNGQFLPAAGMAALGAGRVGLRAAQGAFDKKRNAEIARLLLGTGPAAQQRIAALRPAGTALRPGQAALLQSLMMPATTTPPPFQLLPRREPVQ